MNCKSPEFLELSNEILRLGNRLRFRARGYSMYPFIRDGDILEVEPVDGQGVRLGDVIFYHRAGQRAVVHRVIKKFLQKDKTIFVAKGDANPAEGEIVQMEDILGRVSAVERNSRRIRFDSPSARLMNILCAKSSLFFSQWIHPLLRKIKHTIIEIR